MALRPQADDVRPALPLTPARRRIVTIGLLLGVTLGALEATVVATAMPTVIARLGGLAHYSWVFSAYLLTSTASVPVWGRLSDLRGRRTLYLIGVGIFLLGSALAGTSRSMPQLVLFRALQGLGAGCIVPLGVTIIGEIYTIRERVRMQAVFSGMWGVASIVGPLVGGYITDALSWRWIFFINVPFGLIGASMVGRALPGGAPLHGQPVDWRGAILLTSAVTVLLIGVSDVIGARWPWFVASAIFGLGLVLSYRRTEHPILPLSLLAHRLVGLANLIVFLVGVAMFGAVAFVPLFIQGTMGTTATQAGQALTPLFLGWVSTSVIGVRLMLRIGYRITAQAGVAIVASAFVGLAFLARDPHWTALLGVMAWLGAGMGLSMMSLLLHVQRSVTRAELGLATSLNQFARSIGGAVGVAVMGAILAAGMAAAGGFQAAEGLQAGRMSLDAGSRAAL
ncbi:MAG TPA: MDR family MFS transporter, partial [Vicinamibacterales bacterium]|nr:MDR family MFS transporter [Vicinamibacterales bacterium]